MLMLKDMASMRFRQHFAVGALLLAITATYLNSFHNGFHFDDSHTVIDNPAIRSLGNIPRFFRDATTFSVLPANRTYRPLVSTTLAMDYALGHGYRPLWFHVGTFVLFLMLVIALYVLFGLLLRSTPAREADGVEWIALIAAAWFGLHPAMAETVNYVIQRGDIYCALGCVAGLWFYARWPSLRRAGLYLLPFVAAMLSKAPSAVFPILLLLYVYFFETEGLAEARRWRTAVVAAGPSVVVSGLMLALQSAMTPKTFTPSTILAWDYRMTQPLVWARYATTLFLPLHLNVDTDLEPIKGMTVSVGVGWLFVAGMVAAIVFAARRRRLYVVAYGLLWFVVTQLPTSLYPLSEVENDHRMFFSLPGLIVAVVYTGWLVWRLLAEEKRQRWLPWAAVVVVLVSGVYGYGVHERNKVWKDDESLWLDDVEKCPRNGRGLMNYALTQMEKGAYPRALDYFTRALEFTPNYPTLEINLGILNGAMADEGDAVRSVEAERHFERAMALAPNNDLTHAYYGRWLLQHGRVGEAKLQLQQAVALNPQRLLQHEELIQAELKDGNRAAAVQAAQQTLALAPEDVVASSVVGQSQMQGRMRPVLSAADWVNLSLSQYRLGQYEASITSARSALELDPAMAEAYNNIGAAYAGMHRWDEAIRADEKAVRLKPTLEIARNNLAWATSQKKLEVK
jgi:tetratricopeptide (TPR) repeat protein